AFQCDYCTPGQIMSAVACVNEGHAGNDDDIREYMSGNICRCAAYPNIVAAVKQALRKSRKADRMRSFRHQRAADPSAAVQALSAVAAADLPLEAEAQPLAGGTTLIDLMKLDVMRPRTLVDINPLASQWSAIDVSDKHLHLGAMARMSDVA